MAEKPKKKIVPIIIAIIVLVAAVGGYLLYNAGFLGGDSCAALLRQYERGSKVEDYAMVGEAFAKLMEKGCDF